MCAVVAALTTAIAGHAAAPVRLVVNGNTIAAEAHLIEGSAYLPLRATATALGAQVEWVAERRMVTLCIASGMGYGVSRPALWRPLRVAR
jgi:hypothetical protein